MGDSLFITGIGTGVGKTICSAILTAYFKADYWKPIQSGDLHASDSLLVSELTANSTLVHPEKYRLKLPASPHKAAKLEGVRIKLEDFEIPSTANKLIIEGAGGLLVPLSDQDLMIDLIEKTRAAVALVVRNYLGCINHALLSIFVLQQKKIPIKYLVLNGEFDEDTEAAICCRLEEGTEIIRIPELTELSRVEVNKVLENVTIKKNKNV